MYKTLHASASIVMYGAMKLWRILSGNISFSGRWGELIKTFVVFYFYSVDVGEEALGYKMGKKLITVKLWHEKLKPPIMAEIVRASENKGSNEELLRKGGKKEPCHVNHIILISQKSLYMYIYF